MPTHVAVVDKKATITLEGRLDHSIGQGFREGYESLLSRPGIAEIEIDLGGADYIDSSVLGYFLILRERAGQAKIKVCLVNSQGIVETLLKIAGFERLFTMR